MFEEIIFTLFGIKWNLKKKAWKLKAKQNQSGGQPEKVNQL